jgi:hypothetical protein
MRGGRGRTRTGTPVSQKQILSPPALPYPKFLCGHAFRVKGEEMPMTSKEMR